MRNKIRALLNVLLFYIGDVPEGKTVLPANYRFSIH